jgi:hypothetical protein
MVKVHGQRQPRNTRSETNNMGEEGREGWEGSAGVGRAGQARAGHVRAHKGLVHSHHPERTLMRARCLACLRAHGATFNPCPHAQH